MKKIKKLSNEIYENMPRSVQIIRYNVARCWKGKLFHW